MLLWLIRDGEKYGPHPDYHIRQGIESGIYSTDTPAWHEGLDEWTTLGKMAVFESEFNRPAPEKNPAGLSPGVPPPLPPANLHLSRRFWARIVDLQCYLAVWWLFLYLANFDIGAILANPWILLLKFFPWLPVEAAFIHRHGTTPGKWMLGIRVHNDDGSRLSYRQAFQRSLRVLLAGMGLGMGFLVPICLGLSYWISRRLGRPLWDHIGGHRTTFAPIRGRRYFSVVAVLWLVGHLQLAVLVPHLAKAMPDEFPRMKEFYENHPLPYFPDRHKK